MNDLQHNITQKIKEGELAMHPRWHFALRTSLFVVGTILVALLSIYLLSFVVFFLHQSGILSAPQFGMRGLGLFVFASPWLLISLTLLFLGILFLLVKHYSFSYKRPLVYSVLGIVILAVLGSAVVIKTETHERIQRFSERHALPGLTPLYQRAERPPEGLYLGTIEQVTATGFIIRDSADTELTILVSDNTRMPPKTQLKQGARVAIIGDRKNDTVTALGIKNIKPNQPIPRFRHRQQSGQVIGPALRQPEYKPLPK